VKEVLVAVRRIALVMVLVLIALSCVGCAGRINKVMASWTNHHYSDLIASWGPPQQVYDDGRGGRMLVYTTQRSWTSPGTAVTRTTGRATSYDNYIWGTATSRTTYNPPQTHGYTAYRVFWIDKRGYIYKWQWKGL
jgi:hypothetical protein